MEIEVRWETDNRQHSETDCIWDYAEDITRINPGRVPTEQELSSCPKMFTCLACMEKHSVNDLGGRYHDRWICRFCIPFVDEWTAGALILWYDKRHKSFGKPSVKAELTSGEREEQNRNAIRWCMEKGFPIQEEVDE